MRLRGLIAQSPRSVMPDSLDSYRLLKRLSVQRSQGFRDLPVPRQRTAPDSQDAKRLMSNMSLHRSQVARELPTHRQSNKKWRPPAATNEHMTGMHIVNSPSVHARKEVHAHTNYLNSLQYRVARPSPYSYAQHGSSSGVHIRGGGVGESPGGGQAPGGGSGYHPFGGGMFLSYHDLELALERRGLSVLRFFLGIASTLAIGIGLMWPRIKRWGAAEGAEVAAASLQQDELKEHATALVNALIAEPQTTRNVEEVMKGVMKSLFNDKELKEEMTKYFAEVMSEAMMWPGVIEKGNSYVETVLADEKSIENAHMYFSTAAQRTVNDDSVLNAVTNVSSNFFVHLTVTVCI